MTKAAFTSSRTVQREARSAFFSGAMPLHGPAVQPKLTVNAPGDRYEKEADQVAEAVMRKPDSTSGQADTISHFAAPSITPLQRKCAACEEEEELQRKEDDGAISTMRMLHDLGGGPASVQRLAVDCTAFSKKEEEIDAEDAAALEAAEPGSTSGEEGEVQRKCAECEEEDEVQRACADCNEEEGIQREDDGGGGVASASFESALSASKGGGSGLPSETRSAMEERFGLDFSGVRIHSDYTSAAMNSSINAHAFTHGRDIYFNSGQYSPGTSSGRQLLAHELTHVAQQTGPSVQRKQPDIQRSFYFANRPTKTSGTVIHSKVLPLFVDANPNLFSEVKIPGATKKDVDKNKVGVADFYKAKATLGLKFTTEPGFVTADKDFRAGTATSPGGAYKHNQDAAPVGTTRKPRVRKVDIAPYAIEIGDLKPGASGETVLGEGQIANYIKGIETTRDNVNTYLATRPDESDSRTTKWAADPKPMKSLTVPTDLRYGAGQGIWGLQSRPLALYREGDKYAYLDDAGLVGTLYVYQDRRDGVWSYEWIPDDIPATTGNKDVNQVLNRLNTDIIPALTRTQGTSIAPKRAPAGRYPIYRKPQKFSDEEWKKKHFSPWKRDATKVLGNKSAVKQAEVATGVLDVEKRLGKKVNAPEEVRERGRGLPKIRHWKRFGGFYGWLREKFDVVYVKIKAVVDKVKKKVGALAKKAGSTSFGNWIKAVAKVVFKIFKMVGSWVVTQVMDKLLTSLREGVMANMRKLVEQALPDEAKTYLDKFCALQAEYDGIIARTEDDIITLIFGDKLKLFEAADEIEKKIGYVADIATLIEWGVRLLACASPPAIGCLWNLAIEALKWLFAKLIQTCWFTKEVYAPVINKVNLVKEFPSELASGLVGELNKHLPVPPGLSNWFAPIKVNMDEFKVDCNEAADGSGRLTADRRAIFEIAKEEVEKTGSDEKLKAGMELMLKRGAGPWVLLTKERAEKLKESLETVDKKEITDAIADETKPVPESMTELMGEIGTYTAAEKKLIGDFKAQEAAKKAAKKKVEEILSDPKAAEALAKPYPSNDQLKKDLETLNWSVLDIGTGDFVSVGGRSIFIMKTDTGARTGGYFKHFEKEHKGKTRKMVVDVGEFYVLDPIPKLDGVTFSIREEAGNPGLLFYVFGSPQAKGTFFSGPIGIVFGTFVDITPI